MARLVARSRSAPPLLPGPSTEEAAWHRRDLRAAILLALFCLLVFNANLRSITAGDTYPARVLPFGIWRYRSLYLDQILDVTAQGRSRTAHWIVPGRDGRAISLYPVVLPVLVAVLYLPAVACLHAGGWTDQRLDRAARIMEKAVASLLSAATVALLYLLLRRRASLRDALLLALAFALGTTTWVVSSQALWQHGLGQLLVVGTLLLVTGPCTARRALAAGFLCGLLACNRPPDTVLAAALALYGLWWARRFAPLVVVAGAIPSALVLAYNLVVAGGIAGGYGVAGDATFFRYSLLSGLAGLLFSPARGLFVFSPFLLIVPLGLWRLLCDREERGLAATLGVAVIVQLLLYAKADWRIGASWGPRWLTDLLPFLFWMLVPAFAALSRAGRIAFVVACGVATVIEAVGAFWYTGASDAAILSPPTVREGMRAAWNPRNAPFLAELRHGRAPMDLGIEVEGNLDALEAGGRDVRAFAAGEEIVAAGWALTGGLSPREVLLFLDGQPAGSTSHLFDRPDVRSARHRTSPAGWRVPIRTAGLAPGEHVLGAVARAHAGGSFYYLAERRFTVLTAPLAGREPIPARRAPLGSGRDTGDGLATASLQAAAFLRERQDAAGYWLTSYTGSTRFDQPRQEMNTFLTSVLVDLLDPVAADAGLSDSLRRARSHLAGQVEADGLVRYHGLPDAPTIGTLGCPITPDADDTALVWRIAPGGKKESLSAALSVLERYRTDEGLYRTWLSPPESYRCIDPGKDPNPVDVGIQMHVLLFLAQADPPAARALCGALGRTNDEERNWVYYRKAPLIPILRQADLRGVGCPIRLPASRLRTPVPGQEIWIDTCRLIERFRKTGAPASDRSETLAVLRTLSADGFAPLRRSPPLLYHNDLTASTPRFYWSEEFGYALWLRLYLEMARGR